MRIRMAVVGTALLAAALTACGGGTEKAAQSGEAKEAKAATPTSIKVSDSSLGQILTDQQGRTLYAFTKDKGGSSTCTDTCIATWPALTTGGDVKAGSGLTPALVGKTERTEGATQAKYGEWPLYYYAGDAAPGDLNGQGVDGEWFVVKTDGKLQRQPTS
jgi:predicted lipoprotein with Yx(FWY)xxD motif